MGNGSNCYDYERCIDSNYDEDDGKSSDYYDDSDDKNEYAAGDDNGGDDEHEDAAGDDKDDNDVDENADTATAKTQYFFSSSIAVLPSACPYKVDGLMQPMPSAVPTDTSRSVGSCEASMRSQKRRIGHPCPDILRRPPADRRE